MMPTTWDDNLVDVIYLLAFVATVLATARLARLINIDDISIPLRRWITRKAGPGSKPEKLSKCYWCLTVWIAGGVTVPYTLTAAAIFTPLTWAQALTAWPPTALAVAYASSWVLDKEEL